MAPGNRGARPPRRNGERDVTTTKPDPHDAGDRYDDRPRRLHAVVESFAAAEHVPLWGTTLAYKLCARG